MTTLAAPIWLVGCGGGGGGSGGGASTAAGVTSQQAAAQAGPAIEVTSPAQGAAAGATVIVEGVVSDLGQGVTRVVVDGQEVAKGPGPFTAAVQVAGGVRTIVVEAFDARGGRTERHVSVLVGATSPDPVANGVEVALNGTAAGLASGFQTTTTTPAPAAGMPPVRLIRADASNYTQRTGRVIDRIVIHTIEGTEAGCISWFQNPVSDVSAHYVVSHAGRVTRMVDDEDRAWHCGNWNERAIGIENEGYAGRNNWTDTQYRVLAQLVRALCDRYRIPLDRTHIVGHVEVPGATHTDPGRFFDWSRFMNLVRAGGATTSTTPQPGTDRLTTKLGKELDVAWTPKPSTAAGGVTRVTFDATVTPRGPVAGRGAASSVLRSARAAAPAPAANGVAMAVHQDLVNRSLHAAWRAGALDLPLDGALLAQVAPTTTASLKGASLVALDPTLTSALRGDSDLKLDLVAGLPPVVRGRHATFGALRATISTVDAAGVATPVGEVTFAVRVPVSIEGHGDSSRLAVTSAPTVRIDVAPGRDEAALRQLARAAGPAVVDAVVGALAGAVLPTPPGIDLRQPQGGLSGDTQTVTGLPR